mmetsp:Transcript_19541/g.24100  ORF Transcript_19541/g.24100 Transcript_19541/m.24100 type:complete len:567 (+) Transcript_19541:32-1732(+)
MIYYYHQSNIIRTALTLILLLHSITSTFSFSNPFLPQPHPRPSPHPRPLFTQASNDNYHQIISTNNLILQNNHDAIENVVPDVGITSLKVSSTTSSISSNINMSICTNNSNHQENQFQLYVGTKRGKLLHVLIKSVPTHETIDNDDMRTRMKKYIYKCNIIQDLNEQRKSALKPYPIYCMDVILVKDKQNVIYGGGDRYLTIWEETEQYNKCDNQDSKKKEDEEILYYYNYNWYIQKRLGPHTGWVKDLVYDKKNHLIFSIGCNCVEIWSNGDSKDNNDIVYERSDNQWYHLQKLSIESSKELGSTLSSDLLCLSILKRTAHNGNEIYDGDENDAYDDTNKASDYILAGGVDGRIHLWIIQDLLSSFQKSNEVGYDVIAAHDGRINKILSCHKSKMLFSIGNDGFIQCRDIPMNTTIQKLKDFRTFSIRIEQNIKGIRNDNNYHCEDKVDQNGNDKQLTTRFLSICTLNEEENSTIIAVGTSKGIIYLIRAERLTSSNEIRMEVIDQQSINHSLGDNEHDCHKQSSIHSLCCVSFEPNKSKDRQNSFCFLIGIGHSEGLSFWNACI